jgi:cytochrome c oxidase subunit 3
MPVLTEERIPGGIVPPPAWPDAGDDGGNSDGEYSSFPISKQRVGLWILLVTIVMLFGGLSSAYIVLRGQADWQNIQIPSILWLNTAILLASSAAFEAARHSLRRHQVGAMKTWLLASGALGVSFLAGQLVAWRQLVAAGVYLPSTLHSSFFYILTGLHGIHLIGGMLAMSFVLVRALTNRIATAKDETLKLCALYWHFMDALWVYLFILLVLA